MDKSLGPSSPLICIAGKNDIAVRTLLYLIDKGFSSRLIVCPNKDDLGASGWQPSLVRFANEFNISIVRLAELEQMENLVFLSLEFDQLIRPDNFKSNRLYNLHFSYLPAYKGMYTSALPILRGEAFSGVTLHRIDCGIDTGEIIDQIRFPIKLNQTARDLYFLYMEYGFDLLVSWLGKLCAGGYIRSFEQPSIGASYYSKYSIDYANLKIDLNKSAFEIVCQLRAYSFREYQLPIICGLRLGAWRIRQCRSKSKPGTIREIEPGKLEVSTIDYDLEVSADLSFSWFDVSAHEHDCLPPKEYIDVRDHKGWTPLIRAAFGGNASLCSMLLENGANPNLGNLNGTTPLMYAHSSPHEKQRKEIVSMLIQWGADREQRDRFNRSLEDYHTGNKSVMNITTL